jgi:hypothetical protein
MAAASDPTREEIVRLLTEARFLLDTARHESTRQQVRFAIRDLDEALLWLQRWDLLMRPMLMRVINNNLDNARARLRLVTETVTRHGPDADVMADEIQEP